jgi:SAM-dependent methyltransferase
METELFYQIEKVENVHWWFSARKEIILSVIRNQLRLPAQAQILDAGCGTGVNLEILSRLGIVTGMETDPTALQMAEWKHVGKVVKGSLPDKIPFPENSFDLVTLLDVLEHLEQDVESLTALRKLLKPTGCLLITVPAFPFLWSSHDELNHHKRRYLLPELAEKIQNAGLSLMYISYFNTLLFPLVAVMRWLKIKVGCGEGANDLWLPPKIVNTLMRKIFASEKYCIGKKVFPFGVSIIACAQKPLTC